MNLLPKILVAGALSVLIGLAVSSTAHAQYAGYQQQYNEAAQQYAYQQQLAQWQYQRQQYAYEMAAYQQLYLQMLQAQQNAYYQQNQYSYPVNNYRIYRTYPRGWADNTGGWGTAYSGGQIDYSGENNHVFSSFGEVLNIHR